MERAEKWARASGASFEGGKTAFVHLTRNSSRLSSLPLIINREEVVPKSEIKVLGVILDQQLRFKEHLVRAGKRGLKAAMALKRMKGLNPRTARTLFISKVAPVIDYASPIWSPSAAKLSTKVLNQAQRLGGQAIVGAFRTLGLERAESEAGIAAMRERWDQQQGRFWVKCHTLPAKHPFWRRRRQINTSNRRFRSPLQRIARKFERIDLSHLESIEPHCKPPWHKGFSATRQDREKAISWANTTKDRVLYVDASYRKGNIGIGMYFNLQSAQQGIEDKQCRKIGHTDLITANHAELIAVQQAMEHIKTVWDTFSRFLIDLRRLALPTVIASDSVTALRALSQPSRQSGQSIIRQTCDNARRLEQQGGPEIRLQWVPARSRVKGSDLAHKLAKTATVETLPAIQRTTLGPALKQIKETIEPRQKGKYAIDSALPGKHTRLVYDNGTHRAAKVLCQLRTKHSRLNNDLARTKAVESPDCECGPRREPARHFLFECPRWAEHRTPLLEVAGTRWGDLPFFLGGRTERKTASGGYLDGPMESWAPDLDVVNRTIQFALNTGRLE